ncbi:alpha-2-HS-glycoprotein [Rhineura floridana]|uniref:alpha-2-HS-glycoprotein n=1 Tax=Rhineura floridana TaxID=261503 RepID=UPI002AC87731|nr:alpha-2-HS-glycoprotein [Rhineura floridana]
MKFLVAVALLGQILGCIAVPVLPNPFSPQFPPCDGDPATEHAAAVAVDHINNHNLHGYKYVLNRIEDVKVHPRRPVGKVIFLELDLLETECPVISPVPVVNCSVRPQTQHAVEGDCDIKLIDVEGILKVVSTKCHSSPDSAEDILRICPDCPVLSRLNDPGVVKAANAALSTFNAENANGSFYQLIEVSRGYHTYLPVGVHVEFAIAVTNCSAQEAHDHAENCHVKTGKHAHFGFCKASVLQKFPRPLDAAANAPSEDIHVDCTIYDHQAGDAFVHLTEHHLGKNIPSPGIGHTVLNLIHSHNGTHASHESHSAEVPVVAASPVVKRAVVAAVPLPGKLKNQFCPGKIRFFKV